jgi:ubiquinol-cytochrome c reductase iron-sulfur subunit
MHPRELAQRRTSAPGSKVPGLGAQPAVQGMHREAQLASHSAEAPTRRDFIVIAAQAFAGVGAAVALWPFIQQMNPDASTQALASIEVDLSPVKEGQAITVSWRGKPVFIRNRTAQEVEQANAVKLAELKDPSARNDALPERSLATNLNRTKRGKENWLVLIGICTHLGCIPKGQSMSDQKGNYGGWFCPCHGSHYDTAGRIRLGPAPQNLHVPPYEFQTDTVIKIG